MEDNLQETGSSSDKKTSFLNKPVSKKASIIIICSLVACILLAFLLVSFISDSKPKGHSFNSRPSINDYRRPPVRYQQFDQRPMQKDTGAKPFEERPQMQNPERRPQNWNDDQRRNPRGIFKGETREQEHRRHLMQKIANGDYVDPEERKQIMEMFQRNEERFKREAQNKKQPPEKERPKLSN